MDVTIYTLNATHQKQDNEQNLGNSRWSREHTCGSPAFAFCEMQVHVTVRSDL